MRGLRRWIGVGLVVAGLGGAMGTAAAAPNLIVNGSFETPDVPAGNIGIFPSIPGWSHQARAGTTSSGIEIQDHVAGAPAAGAGNQFVELDSNGPSRIFQDVATSPGSTYRLSFTYSARPGTAAAENHFRVSAGPAAAEIGPLTSGAQTSWTTRTLDFVATAASSRVEFLDLSPEQACGGVAPSKALLWPPNHKLRTITLFGATDPDGDPVAIAITGVVQDEPVNGKGDGNTSPDVVAGPNADQVKLRAERSGRGDGRVYTVAYVAKDLSGASCSGSVTVTVPHDKRGHASKPSGGAVTAPDQADPGHGNGKGHGRGGGPKL